MSSVKNRLNKMASSKVVGLALPKLGPKAKAGVLLTGGYVAKGAKDDWSRGRQMRKGKYAEAPKTYMGRKSDAVFPLASEVGAIAERQAILDGLIANKQKMQKLSKAQLTNLFPTNASGEGVHGRAQRSLLSAKESHNKLKKVLS